MHDLNLSKKGLQLVPSEYGPATQQAIDAGVAYAKKSSLSKEDSLFRLADHNSNGDQTRSFLWVCVASHTQRQVSTGGGCSTFVYPGLHIAGNYASNTSDGKYSYPDPDVDPIPLAYLRFLLNPETSPWRLCLPFVVDLDADRCYENRCIQFQQIDALPWRVWQSFLIGARLPFEKPYKALTWYNLVQAGIPENYAYLLASAVGTYGKNMDARINMNDYGGHEALDNPKKSAEGFMTGVYYEQSQGSGIRKNGNYHSYGAPLRISSGYYAPGFQPQEPSKINDRYTYVRDIVFENTREIKSMEFLIRAARLLYDDTARDLPIPKNIESQVVMPEFVVKRASRIKAEVFDLDL